ncbi:MAG TPA: hypothetical protein VIL07_11420 [Symbiobacteriaceae bacterium]
MSLLRNQGKQIGQRIRLGSRFGRRVKIQIQAAAQIIQKLRGLGPRFAVVATQDGSLDDLADRIFWLDRGRLLGWA